MNMNTFSSILIEKVKPLFYAYNHPSIDCWEDIRLMRSAYQGFVMYKDLVLDLGEISEDIPMFSEIVEARHGKIGNGLFQEHAHIEILLEGNLDGSRASDNRWLLYKEPGRSEVELNRQRKRTWIAEAYWAYELSGKVTAIDTL